MSEDDIKTSLPGFFAESMAYQANVIFQKVSGLGYMHAELSLVPFPDEGFLEKSRFIYTAFVGEHFSLNYVTTKRSKDKYTVLSIPVSSEEYQEIQNFLMRLIDLPTCYNYVDLTMVLAPKFMVNTFMPDVEKDTIPSRVFCSQAVVLALKFYLHKERKDALAEILAGVNSRTCTPDKLFHILQQAGCKEGNIEDFYTMGHIPLD